MAKWQSHEFQLATGLSTKLVPEAVAGKFALQASNVDGFDTFLGLGKMPGSNAINSAAGVGRIDSIHYFEYFDLDRTSKRACLVNTLDSGIAQLKNINLSTGAANTLLDDLGQHAFSASEFLASATLNHRLHMSSPNQNGSNVVTGGRKYDGTRITNWGCLAPGQDSDVVQALDDSTVWDVATASTGGTPAKATITNRIRGAASVGLTPTGSQQRMNARRTFGATNIDTNGSTLLRVWLFIPSGGLQELDPVGVEVTFTSTAVTFLSKFRFTRGALVPGWNLLSMDLDFPTSQGTTGPVASASCIQIDLDITLDGTINTPRQWAWNFLHNLERGDPLATAVAGPNTFDAIAGAGPHTYLLRVTFLTEYGLESNAGPASNAVTLTVGAADAIQLTNIPVSTDPSVIARRIYALGLADTVYGFVGQIDDNITTATGTAVFAPTHLDGGFSVGLDSPPLAGDPDLDATPPEPFLDAVAFNNRIFAVDAATRLNLLPSELGQGEAFPIFNAIQVDEPITAIRAHPDGLLVYTSDKTFQLSGDGTSTSPFSLELINSELGANGPRSVTTAQGVNVAVREKQVYLVEKADNPWYLNGPVQDQWDSGLTAASLGDMFAVSDRGRFRVIFFGKGSSGNFDQLWSYQHTTQGKSSTDQFEGGVDPQDLRNGSWFKLSLPTTVLPLCATIGERASEVPELWVGTSDGYIHVFQDPASPTTNWFTSAGAEQVNATWESSDVPLGTGPDGCGIPTYISLNHKNPGATPTSWTVTITLLTGAGAAVLGSTSFVVVFPAGNSCRRVRIPNIGFPTASWARVKLVNNNISEGGVFRNVRLYFAPTQDFIGETAN